MSRRSYGGLMHMPVWGAFDGSRLVATIRAPNDVAAQQLFRIHNERWPQFTIHGQIREVHWLYELEGALPAAGRILASAGTATCGARKRISGTNGARYRGPVRGPSEGLQDVVDICPQGC